MVTLSDHIGGLHSPDGVATTAVRGQRFIPAQRRGVVVRTVAEQTVRFALGERGSGSQP